jgi:exopolysaccharide production protein ExoQ
MHSRLGRREADPQLWVNKLTVVVLTLTLLYLIVGIPEFNHSAATDIPTDAVDPIHRFAWLGLFAAAMPVAAKRWRETIGLLAACWPLVLLYLYFAISVSWALDPDVSLRRFILSAMQVVQMAILISGLKRAATLHILVATACIIGATADFITLVVAPHFAMADDGFAGLQSQKNQTGLIMMYGCLATGTAFFLVQGRRLRIAAGGALAMMAGLLVLTRSTTSQSVVLMTPVVIPAMMFVARRSRATIWAVVWAILATLAAVAFGYLAWCGVTGTDPWLPLRGVTFTQRTDIWSFVVGEIGKRPWLGAGYNSFWAINPEIQPSLKSDDWFGTYAIINEAHDGYLDLLAMGGIVGLLGGMAVIFRTIGQAGIAIARAEPVEFAWRTGRMAYPTAVFHMALLIGLLVHNFTESSLFNSGVLGVGLIVAALDLQKWRLATREAQRPRYPSAARDRFRGLDRGRLLSPSPHLAADPAGSRSRKR